MSRVVCYVSGSRADFGLMESTLRAIHQAPDLTLGILVTGMHLATQYGSTVRDIEVSGLPIVARIPVELEPATGRTMACNIGRMLCGIVEHLDAERPDVVLVLGDRGEMLAGALAALHLNIPVAHVHGGERSGTVDEPIRHAISKVSHYHFVATLRSRERLVRMGEQPDHIWVTGAPGLDGIEALATRSRGELAASIGFDPDKRIAMMVYHPVVQEDAVAGRSAHVLLSCLLRHDVQVLAMAPNSDSGSEAIQRVLSDYAAAGHVQFKTHLGRSDFVSWMAAVDLLIGNSSAGIIEAASFGTPVVNVGSRQNLRERNANVIDAPVDAAALEKAIQKALQRGRTTASNIYGDGASAARIVELLSTVPLDLPVLAKSNVY